MALAVPRSARKVIWLLEHGGGVVTGVPQKSVLRCSISGSSLLVILDNIIPNLLQNSWWVKEGVIVI